MTVHSKSRPAERARFSFDLSAEGESAVERSRPARRAPPGLGGPSTTSTTARTSLSPALERSRTARDCPPDDRESQSDRDSDDLPPLDFPLDLPVQTQHGMSGRGSSGPGTQGRSTSGPEAKQPEGPLPVGDAGWLGPIRRQFREARLRVEHGRRAAGPEREGTPQHLDPTGESFAPGWTEPAPRARSSARQRAATPPGATKHRSARAFVGPLLMVTVAVGAYVAATTSYGLLAPSLSRKAPRVPDLGSLGSPGRTSATPHSGKKGGSNAAASSSGAPKAPAEPVVETGPMPSGLSYPGRGLLEVVTSERELVYVDGIFVGRGPLRRIPLQPGQHGILIRSGGNERKAQALVSVGASTQVHFEVAPAEAAAADGAAADGAAADGAAANGAEAEELE